MHSRTDTGGVAHPRAFLDVTHAAVMPPVAALQDAWARAAEARGLRLCLDRLTPAYLVTPAAPVLAFRRLGDVAGPGGAGLMSAEAAERMRRRISQVAGVIRGDDGHGAGHGGHGGHGGNVA